jgi:hypothetical protein
MANLSTAQTQSARREPTSLMPLIAPAIGWLIPGAGHMIQKRWLRGGLLLLSIASLFL